MVFGTNTTYLSNAVNTYFGCNFKQLVNSYRVKYAKELLAGGECLVKDLFKKSGFISKSAFYMAFHKHVGMTPLKYLVYRNIDDIHHL
ncbi:MAG: helix-turn-helix domain-containing protein [Phocaeicola sp.]|nr:helix-turn-helix domain-containing protein [Phocaeicola sp.]